MHYPAAWKPAKVRRLAIEMEFYYAELTDFFGFATSKPVEVYLYPNADVKKRLMGARNVRIAKPWQWAFHVQGGRIGDRVILHEMAHVFSAEIANPPHHLSWGGLLPNMGLIEGLAVAATWQSGRLNPHQWTAAMQRNGRAPKLQKLLQPTGFVSHNSRAAYTVCGSFVRWYREQLGPKAAAELYRTGAVAELERHSADWAAFVAAQPLSERSLAEAEARYDGPTIFTKICAHEVAALRRQAGKAITSGRRDEALELTGTILGHVPDDVRARLWRVGLLHALGRSAEAEPIARRLMEDERAGRVARARAREWVADFDAFAGRKEASVHYDAVAKQAYDRAQQRRLAVKQQALERRHEGVLKLLTLPTKKVDAQLAEVARGAGDWGVAQYLWGRRQVKKKKWSQGLAALRNAASLGLPHDSLRIETHRLIARALFDKGDYAQASAAFDALASRGDVGLEQAEREGLRLWARRARWFGKSAQERGGAD